MLNGRWSRFFCPRLDGNLELAPACYNQAFSHSPAQHWPLLHACDISYLFKTFFFFSRRRLKFNFRICKIVALVDTVVRFQTFIEGVYPPGQSITLVEPFTKWIQIVDFSRPIQIVIVYFTKPHDLFPLFHMTITALLLFKNFSHAVSPFILRRLSVA